MGIKGGDKKWELELVLIGDWNLGQYEENLWDYLNDFKEFRK
jgi:hypothetical protein